MSEHICADCDPDYDPWDDYDEPEPCPMGCGRTTENVAGGPCYACWEKALRDGGGAS